MAEAGSKTTAVHFSLVFFVLLSVILAVVAYLGFKDAAETALREADVRSELQSANNAGKRYIEEIDKLKALMGFAELTEIGAIESTPGTVIREAEDTIARYGTDPAETTFAASLRDLRGELESRSAELAEANESIVDLQARLAALEGQFSTRESAHDEARRVAEKGRTSERERSQELVAGAEREVDELRKSLADAQFELTQTRDQLTNRVRQLENERDRLIQKNDGLRDQVYQLQNVSFEVPDGRVVYVDSLNDLVWINLGSEDGLQERTNFSIYTRLNSGVARDQDDIKGAIEVTKITGPHLAEARILSNDIARPIGPEDPIYTPLWSPGTKERFAFVGMVDLDGDGEPTSEDRAILYDLIENTGAEISSEVNDDGERLGDAELDETTRFLVVGNIPDYSDAPTPEAKAAIERMLEHAKRMKDEARLQGIRVVSLSQFKDYVGYSPKRRLWKPGQKWNLQAGQREDRDNVSSGRVSGIYEGEKPAGPDSSSGAVSGSFFGN
ncbi:MAG: hypothetical protein AAF532_08140 [Planctomycetota bacterium]